MAMDGTATLPTTDGQAAMTKAQRHKAEAARSYREADRLRGMAYAAEDRGKLTSAAVLRHAAELRTKAALAHERAFKQEIYV
jgi:hypothetical protein